jgi:hypothetical protein
MKTTLFLLPLTLLFISCQKEVSFEDNNPGSTIAAVYSFSESPDAFIIAGNYSSGVALSSINAVSVKVNVTTAGIYTIFTNTVNGYKFSATGKFTTTGVQFVMLSGEGLPVRAQGDLFSIFSLGPKCSFTINIGVPGPAVFSLVGAPNACVGTVVNGIYVNGVTLSANNNVNVRVNITSIGVYSISTNTVDGITFSKTGTFTSTGIQNIILIGSGTPTGTGAKIFTVGTGGCRFTLTVAGAAVYGFSGAPSICTVSTLTGIFKVGIALTTANTITVQVNVSVIGSYIITSNTIGGITFSKAGVFSTTGLQPITLVGAGIPSVAGSNGFLIVSNGCMFFVTVIQ